MKLEASRRERVIVTFVLLALIATMASVFDPGPTRATSVTPAIQLGEVGMAALSANPHEGLDPLGCLEGGDYRIEIYAADDGVRYSIYEAATGFELELLLTAEQVAHRFPELPILDLDADTPIMADTPVSDWY